MQVIYQSILSTKGDRMHLFNKLFLSNTPSQKKIYLVTFCKLIFISELPVLNISYHFIFIGYFNGTDAFSPGFFGRPAHRPAGVAAEI